MISIQWSEILRPWLLWGFALCFHLFLTFSCFKFQFHRTESSLYSRLPSIARGMYMCTTPTHMQHTLTTHTCSILSYLLDIVKVNLPSSLRPENYYVTSEEQNTKRSMLTTSKFTEIQTDQIPWNLGEYDLRWVCAPKMGGQWIFLTIRQD